MKNTNEKILENMFLLSGKYKNCYDLRDHFVIFYYYQLDPQTRNKTNISTLWGIIYRDWEKTI